MQESECIWFVLISGIIGLAVGLFIMAVFGRVESKRYKRKW
jgi:ABC-type antimicrobial peptide transport system permease subunit